MDTKHEQPSLLNEQDTNVQRSVECLGLTFESDEARRAHFLEILREKLRDPEFRKIEGFPIGDDEDILALSDPPYYTACPNPFIDDFFKYYGKPFDPDIPYRREPFAADVSEGKTDPIYNAHSYHTKVPHKAIMRYILHYTDPGDVVFDGFCGTGMTGVAAQMCDDRKVIETLGYKVREDGTILDENDNPFSRLGSRNAVLNDLSPAATFITHNYTTSVDAKEFEQEASQILKKIEKELGWMYVTLHQPSPAQIAEAISGFKTSGTSFFSQESKLTWGRINYTVWSDVFVCNECSGEIVLWEVVVDLQKKEVHERFPCPHCQTYLTKRSMSRAWQSTFDKATNQIIKQGKQVPILINYKVANKRFEKVPDDFDLSLVQSIEDQDIPFWFPTDRMPEGDESRRNDDVGITHIHQFYIKRNLWVLGAVRSRIKGDQLLFWMTAAIRYLSKLSKLGTTYYLHGGGGAVNAGLLGTLYIPSFSVENSVIETLSTRLPKLSRVFATLAKPQRTSVVSTQSSSNFLLPDASMDYIFLDPPFGANFMYSELNFLWETWLKVFTDSKPEAIENSAQGKTLDDYRRLMTICLGEAFRILKPGRWITVEFSNTQASVWNAIQIALQEAGFVVANVSALDKQQGSFKAVTTTTAVKQDLVISAYKPNGGLEDRFPTEASTENGVWDFVRSHLKYLPNFKITKGEMEIIAERDPRILYDRMVAYFVQHGFPVPLSSQDFQAGLDLYFPQRDGMYFLPEQVAEYDKKRITAKDILQLQLLITDEWSAIQWLKQKLSKKPQTFQELHPDFIKELGGWQKKHERQLELLELLEQNFLRYDGLSEVPSQIHSYLSTNFKDLRNLSKDDPVLRAKAKDRWYFPDLNKSIDLERLREKRLLKEFEEYKTSKSRQLKLFRLEAIRAGFKKAWQERDYQTVLDVARNIPENILLEDRQLLMWYDQAKIRTGDES
ncbi:MAG TPA: DNA methyltransferase [Ktedonobacteraceae bacterium]|nr:DNA methyltransferase [Ktedonobacteraceae bacterium]